MISVIEYISFAMIPFLILSVIILSLKNKVSIYDAFIEGAKEGFTVIFNMFPSMLAIILVINLFKVSRLYEYIYKMC